MTEKEKMVEVVEETPAETKTPQAFVNEEISDDATNEQLELPALETMRNTFSKMYRKFRIFSYVSTAIVIAVIVVSYAVSYTHLNYERNNKKKKNIKTKQIFWSYFNSAWYYGNGNIYCFSISV